MWLVAFEGEIAPAQTDRLKDAQAGRGEQLEPGGPLAGTSFEQPNELARVRKRRLLIDHARPRGSVGDSVLRRVGKASGRAAAIREGLGVLDAVFRVDRGY